MLEIIDLRYRHRGVKVDEYRYDLEVGAGEIACLTGKSGSGKSTCLDLVAGFLQPHGGQVRIGGMDILHLPPEKRPLTILFQSDNLFDHLSAAQNVALGANTSLKLTGDEEREVAGVLERVGLLPLAGQPAGQLSGGEQQRVALARCLIRKRPVLLLDEPFGALDTETGADMISLVRDIVSEQSLATLMVTHDFDSTEWAADRHYELGNGRIERLK